MPSTILRGDAAVGAAQERLRESNVRESGNSHFARPARPAHYEAALSEAYDILEAALSGRQYGLARLEEAMGTRDFPIYLAAIIDRELLPEYQSLAGVWQQFARRTTVADFRKKKFVDLLGGRGILERVTEGAPYPHRKLTDAEYEIAAYKYGAIIGLTFEAFRNDELGDFRTMPGRLAAAAVDTEDYLATSLLSDGDGPNSAFFNADNGNAPDNKPLTLDNLRAAVAKITDRRDVDGRPIAFPGFRLVIPPGLDVVANDILNATSLEITDGSKKLTVTNTIKSRVTPVVNPWLPVVDANAKAAATWYLLPDPTVARPAIALAFLRGHETPDLRVRNDQGTSLSGGSIDPTEGSFDDDTTQYRVRHISGGATLDAIGTYVSTGS